VRTRFGGGSARAADPLADVLVHCLDVGVAVCLGGLARRGAVARIVVRDNIDAQVEAELEEKEVEFAYVHRVAVRPQDRCARSRVDTVEKRDGLTPACGYGARL